ncbi:MAG TPA: hypothetical protein HA362_00855 [Nanoarchaeota archaeon]|nr:hypothetical protein [Nanoarchaeota archaeon]
MRILVFGNPLVEKDSLPLKLVPELRTLFPSIEFIECSGMEDIASYGRRPLILDTVQGIKEPCIIHIADIQKQKVLSMHDCDLGFNLLLLKKLKKIDDAVIIAVPMNITKKAALGKVKRIIAGLKA